MMRGSDVINAADFLNISILSCVPELTCKAAKPYQSTSLSRFAKYDCFRVDKPLPATQDRIRIAIKVSEHD